MNICSQQFVDVIRPHLSTGDAAGMAQAVLERWRPRQVCRLLQATSAEVRRLAALTLGLVADRSAALCLAQALHDEDAQVNEMAEHSLWSIWFRSGSRDASEPFQRGVACLEQEDHAGAIESFTEAIQLDPTFAEAYSQRATAFYLEGEYEQSIRDARRTLRLMPMNFAALSGMGHCYAELGELEQALACYRGAVRINPRMAGMDEAIEQLEAKLDLDADAELLVLDGPGRF